MRTTIVQQDLQIQDPGNVTAPENAAVLKAGESADTDMAAQRSSKAWSSDHPINVRISIPLPFGRYYLTIVGGKERRSPTRRKEERRKHPLATTGNILFLGLLGLITGSALSAVLHLAARSALEQVGALVQ